MDCLSLFALHDVPLFAWSTCLFVPTLGNKPKKGRDPLLRHNSIDDEMRFSGLHSKADIPSKAFQRLTKMSINDDGQEVPAEKDQGEPSGRFPISKTW